MDAKIEEAVVKMSTSKYWILLSVNQPESSGGTLNVLESKEQVALALIATLITNSPAFEKELVKAVEHMRIKHN